MRHDLVLRSRRVLLPAGTRPASVAIRNGRVSAVAAYDAPLEAAQLRDLGELSLLPGVVDTHVHVNEPGRTAWEGFSTATRAATAGGVTTIVDMPLNSIPPTVDLAALRVKRDRAAGQVYTDVGFWGGAIPGNAARLAEMYEAGVLGFKCFTTDSGVTEFPPLDTADLRAAFTAATACGAPMLVHAEDTAVLRSAPPAGRTFASFLASRPAAAEADAVERVLDMARHTDTRVHILHLSTARAAALVAAAGRDGVAVSAETCPHYLTLEATQVPDAATSYKCCPPIRDADNREALWEALRDGAIACVVSDHSPCAPELKRGDFAAAWGGISSVQLGLPLLWSEARRRGLGLPRVVEWMCRGPAELAGLSHKGHITVGADADLVAFDPDQEWTIRADRLLHRHPITPYDGRTVTGAVTAVWRRGRPIGAQPAGQLLREESG